MLEELQVVGLNGAFLGRVQHYNVVKGVFNRKIISPTDNSVPGKAKLRLFNYTVASLISVLGAREDEINWLQTNLPIILRALDILRNTYNTALDSLLSTLNLDDEQDCRLRVCCISSFTTIRNLLRELNRPSSPRPAPMPDPPNPNPDDLDDPVPDPGPCPCCSIV